MLTALCKMYPNSMTSDDVLLYRPAFVCGCSSNVCSFLRTNSSTIHTSTQIMLALSYSLPSILALLSPLSSLACCPSAHSLSRSRTYCHGVGVVFAFILLFDNIFIQLFKTNSKLTPTTLLCSSSLLPSSPPLPHLSVSTYFLATRICLFALWMSFRTLTYSTFVTFV